MMRQPRYLLTSLALNDFAIGLLITPFGVLPALFHCWPYGEIYCQIQVIHSINCTLFGLFMYKYIESGKYIMPLNYIHEYIP